MLLKTFVIPPASIDQIDFYIGGTLFFFCFHLLTKRNMHHFICAKEI